MTLDLGRAGHRFRIARHIQQGHRLRVPRITRWSTMSDRVLANDRRGMMTVHLPALGEPLDSQRRGCFGIWKEQADPC